MRWCKMTALIQSWKNWTDVGRSRKTETKRRRSKRPSSRHRGTSKWKRPSCPYVARRKLNFQQLENALGTPLPAVIKGYATLRDAKLAESSFDKVVMWTGGSYDYDDVVRALVRLDRPEKRPGTSGQSGKTVPTYFTDPEVGAPTIVSRFRDSQPSMDRPHWNEVLDVLQRRGRFSARTERRRSHAMERSPSRGFSTSPTMVRRQLKKTRYRRYYCRLDQLSDILGTGLSERISILRRSPGVSSAPDEVQVAERSGAAHEALEHSTAEISHEVCKMSQTWTLGSRVSRRKSRTMQR